MSPHLLLVALGPVQEFIAQARRTRDLWFGSHLLSEISRAAARALVEQGAELFFPALSRDDPELAPCPSPLRSSGQPPLAIVNKIFARVSGDPRQFAEAARGAALSEWKRAADRVRHDGRRSKLLAPGINPTWDEQIDDMVEFYAMWVPMRGGYAEAREILEETLGPVIN
jgi:CRISPR-associated protein Cmr2